jgi:polyisoprenoid-binding protein YceI
MVKETRIDVGDSKRNNLRKLDHLKDGQESKQVEFNSRRVEEKQDKYTPAELTTDGLTSSLRM